MRVEREETRSGEEGEVLERVEIQAARRVERQCFVTSLEPRWYVP